MCVHIRIYIFIYIVILYYINENKQIDEWNVYPKWIKFYHFIQNTIHYLFLQISVKLILKILCSCRIDHFPHCQFRNFCHVRFFVLIRNILTIDSQSFTAHFYSFTAVIFKHRARTLNAQRRYALVGDFSIDRLYSNARGRHITPGFPCTNIQLMIDSVYFGFSTSLHRRT